MQYGSLISKLKKRWENLKTDLDRNRNVRGCVFRGYEQ